MLRLIFSIIVLVLILSFFGISIQSIVHSPTGQENFGFIGGLARIGWEWLTTVFNLIVSIITRPFAG